MIAQIFQHQILEDLLKLPLLTRVNVSSRLPVETTRLTKGYIINDTIAPLDELTIGSKAYTVRLAPEKKNNSPAVRVILREVDLLTKFSISLDIVLNTPPHYSTYWVNRAATEMLGAYKAAEVSEIKMPDYYALRQLIGRRIELYLRGGSQNDLSKPIRKN